MRALIYIIDALSMLITLVFLLRFWLPWFRVDFRNPLAQGILQVTSPIINPLRRMIPAIGRVDTATILVAYLVQALTLILVILLNGNAPGAKFVLLAAAFQLAILSLRLFMFAIIIRIVLSWVAPQIYNPVSAILGSMTEPLLAPFRRVIPPVGGFDISPVFAIILLGALSILLQDSLAWLL
ncbi:MAG: YggT family protein [Gammaproteobacteria bacterium]|nr:YggT family protein [Gammaproteobacteria bacterium]MDH5305258.1 YggT family protein [Gammaproteobacteria bacterium]